MKSKLIKSILFLLTVLIASMIEFIGYQYLYPNSSCNKFVRENEVLDDFWVEYNLIENKTILSELQNIAKNSQYPNNKLRATTALMTIYTDGMKGELKDYHKAYYWCNEISIHNQKEYNLSNCNRFIESK